MPTVRERDALRNYSVIGSTMVQGEARPLPASPNNSVNRVDALGLFDFRQRHCYVFVNGDGVADFSNTYCEDFGSAGTPRGPSGPGGGGGNDGRGGPTGEKPPEKPPEAETPPKTDNPENPARWPAEKCDSVAKQIAAMKGSLQATLNAANQGRSFLGTSRDYFVTRRTTTPFDPVEAISTAGDSLSAVGFVLMPWSERMQTATLVMGTISNLSSQALAGRAFQRGEYGDALMFSVGAITDLASIASNSVPALKVVTEPVDIGKGFLSAALILNDQYSSAMYQHQAERTMKAHYDEMKILETNKRADISTMESQYNEHCPGK